MGGRAGQPVGAWNGQMASCPKTVSQDCPHVQWTLLSLSSTIAKKPIIIMGVFFPKGMARVNRIKWVLFAFLATTLFTASANAQSCTAATCNAPDCTEPHVLAAL